MGITYRYESIGDSKDEGQKPDDQDNHVGMTHRADRAGPERPRHRNHPEDT